MNIPSQPDSDTIEADIVALIAKEAGVPPNDLDVEDNLLTSGLVDSIGMVRIIAQLEEQLGVTVPPPDLVPENFRTIRVMAVYMAGLVERS